MVESLVVRPDDLKQDPGVYDADFEVVFLVKGPRTASTQEGLDFLDLYHSCLEGERHFRLVVALTLIPPDAHPACTGPPGDISGHIRGLGTSTLQVGGRIAPVRGFSRPLRLASLSAVYAVEACTWYLVHGQGEGSANLHDDFHHLGESPRRSQNYAGAIRVQRTA